LGKFLLWDFDGTLGFRRDGLRGRAWSMSMLEAIINEYSRTDITINDITPFLRQGFPWHTPEIEHIHLNSTDRWWAHIRNIFSNIYVQLGFSKSQAEQLAYAAQARFIDLETWALYDDTIPVLMNLYEQGWKHIIVSNHVPELNIIAEHLGLASRVSSIINSAWVGYEKPHPEIYKLALEKTDGASNVWMIGDNIHADVLGAQQVGISSILVRNQDDRAKYQFQDLKGVEGFLSGLA